MPDNPKTTSEPVSKADELPRQTTPEARLILLMAPSFQGGHSDIGEDVAVYLGIPFPLKMDTYHAQMESAGGVGTPGGLEHMGDVWKLLASWERRLKVLPKTDPASDMRDNSVPQMKAALKECADELESYIDQAYGASPLRYQSMKRRYDRDMEIVREARRLLEPAIACCMCITCQADRAIHISFEEQAQLPRRYGCEICGNKRCPHNTDHRLTCTNSNKPGQPGSIFGGDVVPLPPCTWACDTCSDQGWVDESIGGTRTSGWVECPDCGNPHGGTHP